MSVPVSPEGQRGHIGVGTKLEYSTNDGGSFTEVARLTEIGDINFGSANEVDVTGYDTTGRVREKIAGFEDAGSLDITGVWIAHESQVALVNNPDLKEVNTWRATLPHSLGVVDFDAYLTGVTITSQLDDRIEFSAELVFSGKPVLTISGDGDGDGDAGDA